MTPTSVGMRCPECARQRTRVVTARSMYAGTAIVTQALIVINVAVFLGELVTGVSLTGGSFGGSSLVFHGALYGPLVASGDYWRLITSGFLHANLIHIGFNMYALYFLGRMLEPVVGHARFALIYFVSLLAGSFGALLVTPHAFTVGASGAVFGIAGAAVVDLRHRGVDPMQSGLPLFIGINLLLGFTLSGISIGGHIGGLIGGALTALVLHQADMRRGVPAAVGPLLAAGIGVIAVIGAIAVA
jgi:membrane associated rhomboid family serine protease